MCVCGLWNRENSCRCRVLARRPNTHCYLFGFVSSRFVKMHGTHVMRQTRRLWPGLECVCVCAVSVGWCHSLHWIDMETYRATQSKKKEPRFDLKYARRMVIYLNYWEICREFRQPAVYDMIKCMHTQSAIERLVARSRCWTSWWCGYRSGATAGAGADREKY